MDVFLDHDLGLDDRLNKQMVSVKWICETG
jgi:hypothetical protein